VKLHVIAGGCKGICIRRF